MLGRGMLPNTGMSVSASPDKKLMAYKLIQALEDMVFKTWTPWQSYRSCQKGIKPLSAVATLTPCLQALNQYDRQLQEGVQHFTTTAI